jgi:CXXC-20-CXXC protein
MWAFGFVSDKRKFECAACGHHFRYKESICEDWRDPNKSFLCPKCKAYLEVPAGKKIGQIMKYGLPVLVIAFCLSIYYSDRTFIQVTVLLIGGAFAIAQTAPYQKIQTKVVGVKNAA